MEAPRLAACEALPLASTRKKNQPTAAGQTERLVGSTTTITSLGYLCSLTLYGPRSAFPDSSPIVKVSVMRPLGRNPALIRQWDAQMIEELPPFMSQAPLP